MPELLDNLSSISEGREMEDAGARPDWQEEGAGENQAHQPDEGALGCHFQCECLEHDALIFILNE